MSGSTVLKVGILVSAMGLALGAQAANVTLYGSISTGVVVNNTAKLATSATEKQNSVTSTSMQSAWYGDSIFGLTGEEDLGNGWNVGFTLENEYNSDSGQLASDGTLFDSQAYLRIGNEWLNIAAGNLGGLASAGGDFDMMGQFDPLEAAFGVGGMGAFASRDYATANALVVQITPMQGLTLAAMGNLGEDDSPSQWSKRTHYYAIGATYTQDALALGATIEMYKPENDAQITDNGYTYTIGASYDIGMIKPMFMYQHADKIQNFQGNGLDMSAKIDSILLGATAPIGEGSLLASVQYMKLKGDTQEEYKADTTILGVAYTYPMSKRTTLYSGATYAVGGKGFDKDWSTKYSTATINHQLDDMRASFNGFQVGVGVAHTF